MMKDAMILIGVILIIIFCIGAIATSIKNAIITYRHYKENISNENEQS